MEARNNKLDPVYDNIKILPDNTELKSSRILLPKEVAANQAKKTKTGIIVAIGDGCEERKVGERVLYGEYAGFPRCEDEEGNQVSEGDGVVYRYCVEADVIAVFNSGKGGKK